MRLLPSFIQRRIEHRPNLVKIIDNISWLFLDKILRMGVGLFVGVWLARYLGPEQFGQFNYVIAFVSLFGVISAMGLQSIVVRDIVKDPGCANETLGTAFILQLIAGVISTILIIITIFYLRPEGDVIKVMVAILGFSLVFKSSEVIKYWFESQVQSRYTVWVENGVFLTMSVLKIIMILNNATLIVFIGILLAESVLVSLILFALYSTKENKIRYWSIRLFRAKSLLSDSWPLILSAVAVIIYLRIDQIMLGEIVDEKAVGIYSAAIKISEVWYMMPVIISATLFPSIIKLKEKDVLIYSQRIQQLLNLMVTIALVISLFVTLLSDRIISFLYGSEYELAAIVLIVHVWASVFVFIGVAGNKALLAENMQRYILYRTAIGAAINIMLNLILIPEYGVVGAAIATVISYSFSDYFLDIMVIKKLDLFKKKTIAVFIGPYLLIKSSYCILKN